MANQIGPLGCKHEFNVCLSYNFEHWMKGVRINTPVGHKGGGDKHLFAGHEFQ